MSIIELSFVIVIVVAWLAGMWAMIRMWINGIRAGESKWTISPSVLLANYNSKYFRICLACVLAAIVAGIAYNFLSSWRDTSNRERL